jgi:hypothetical protein
VTPGTSLNPNNGEFSTSTRSPKSFYNPYERRQTAKKNQDKKPHESLEEFGKRVGLKYIKETGGTEFAPYRGLQKAAPKRST